MTYELPLGEKLITFADACDKKDIEESRAFYLVVEREEKLWLRRVVLSHAKLLGEEELEREDLFGLDRPGETAEHAVFAEGKLYLKSERQIAVANEGVVEFPEGLTFKTNLVHSANYSLECLGALQGVTQVVSVYNSQVTPHPNASGISFYSNAVAKVYPALAHHQSEQQGWFTKKPTHRLSTGLHDAAFGHRDLFQDGVQSLLFYQSSPEPYSEHTVVFGKQQLSYTYSSQHNTINRLLIVTAFSRYSKYLEIKRSLKG